MLYKYINYNETLPFNISIAKLTNEEYHWHKEIELSIVLKGSLSYKIKGLTINFIEHDLIFINSFDPHSLISKGNDSVLLTFHLNPIFFDQYYPYFSNSYFLVSDSINDRSKPFYNSITKNLAKIMLSIIKLNRGYKLDAINCATDIVISILNNVQLEIRNSKINDNYKLERSYEILKFIEEDYSADLSLNSISEKLSLTPQYISKFFKTILGIGFVDYIHKIRVQKSLSDLLGSEKTILDIAFDSGFNDHKAYSRVFKKEYGVTPSEYRKINLVESNIKTTDTDDKIVFEDLSNNNFKYLFDFIKKDNIINNNNISDKLTLNISMLNQVEKPMEKFWNKITSIGRAALCLRHEIRKQIEIIQKDMQFEYIRFHGIFSDEMLVYREDPEGNPLYNWNYVDEIIDFFYDIKLKPFIELGFMPEALSTKKQYASFYWKTNISYPSSIDKWKALVSEFINHCIERYGENEVNSWYFEIWSAPDLGDLFWNDTKERFFKFYKETFFAIKSISKNIKVGTPGILAHISTDWVNSFFEYCKKSTILFDFISCHVYASTDPKNTTLPKGIINLSQKNYELSDINYLNNALTIIKHRLDEYSINTELIITEWNLSPYTQDYTRDTCFSSTYITNNLLSNINENIKLVFWNLSDIVEEGTSDNRLFHGGLGLFTYNGMKKASYNAFYLLNKLGNNLISSGADYIVTSKGTNTQVLIYNYAYFDELFRSGDKSLLSYHERYNIYTDANKKNVDIVLTLPEGNYKVKRSELNTDNGSIFDAWIHMGAPEEINRDVYNFLKAKELPNIHIKKEAVKNTLLLNAIVPVHGVLLFEIDKIS